MADDSTSFLMESALMTRNVYFDILVSLLSFSNYGFLLRVFEILLIGAALGEKLSAALPGYCR